MDRDAIRAATSARLQRLERATKDTWVFHGRRQLRGVHRFTRRNKAALHLIFALDATAATHPTPEVAEDTIGLRIREMNAVHIAGMSPMLSKNE